jgi:signal transduction histidine kinase
MRTSEFDWRLASKCVVGFVALHLVYRVVFLASTGRLGSMLELYVACSAGLAVALGFGLCRILGAVARRGLAIGLASAAVLALPTGLASAAGDLAFRYYLSPQLNKVPTAPRNSERGVVTQSAPGDATYRANGQAGRPLDVLAWRKERFREEAISLMAQSASTTYFIFFGLGAFFVGMSSARRLQAAERKASEFERLAHSAQLRALRYQVNPHFLFNTLNSLSSLVMARRLDESEIMILNLSAFFRSALAIDPTEDVTLVEEIRLQRLYLDIEHARFPGRLSFNVTVPPMLESAQVPALLLQPLIENAIKYSVGRTEERVTIGIVAKALGDDFMRLIVEDSGPVGSASPLNPESTGVGLSNVRQRLQARFGEAASFESGVRSGGGYRVEMTLPVVRA